MISANSSGIGYFLGGSWMNGFGWMELICIAGGGWKTTG